MPSQGARGIDREVPSIRRRLPGTLPWGNLVLEVRHCLALAKGLEILAVPWTKEC